MPTQLQKIIGVTAACAFLLSTSAIGDDGEVPSTEKWVPVKTVSTEYTHVRGARCKCGGVFEVEQQSTGEVKDRRYDRLDCKCRACGERRAFIFDVTGIFAEYEIARSDEARTKAFAELKRRFPKLSPDLLPELKRLLKDENPHVRAWGIEGISKLATPEAREILLDGYLDAGLIGSVEFQKALYGVGTDLLPLIDQRLMHPENAVDFGLMSLLKKIKSPESARLAERELRRELLKEKGWRRICYTTLGTLGFKESEAVLLEAFETERAKPDDSLIWALGRCGTRKSVPLFRECFNSTDVKTRLAGIAAVGLVGDNERIPELLKIATGGIASDFEHNAIHNAIHALGHLRAKDAVPLLIKNLRATPKCEYFYSPIGIFDDAWTYAGDYVNVSIQALQRIGAREALPEFERILGDDKYCLNFSKVADAAAELDWREAVPAIIGRLAKDYERNAERLGKQQEIYSPSLRKLTGQPFGEEPKAWQAWLAQQALPSGDSAK